VSYGPLSLPPGMLMTQERDAEELLFRPRNLAKLGGLIFAVVSITVSSILWLMAGRTDTVVIAQELAAVKDRQRDHHARPSHEGTPAIIERIVDKEIDQAEKALNAKIDGILWQLEADRKWQKERFDELQRRLPP
jgi:hypothetical protein